VRASFGWPSAVQRTLLLVVSGHVRRVYIGNNDPGFYHHDLNGLGRMMSKPEVPRDEGDDVIAAVREARHRISQRFGHDPYRLVEYYMERQKTHRSRLIPAPEHGADSAT
jgi:hypothetical protein